MGAIKYMSLHQKYCTEGLTLQCFSFSKESLHIPVGIRAILDCVEASFDIRQPTTYGLWILFCLANNSNSKLPVCKRASCGYHG